MTTTTKALEFAGMIARMTTEREMRGGMPSEDAVATVNDLIAQARKITGINPGHTEVYCPLCGEDIENCDCEPAGQCLTCGTQCDGEGICPTCASLEWAQEERRTAKDAEASRAADREVMAVLSTPLEACRKCGAHVTLVDVLEGSACVDQGEGDEAGKVFVYCSEHCKETH